MTDMTARHLPAILGAYDFSGRTRIVDVGGGQGVLPCAILECYPHVTGVLAALPAVVEDARELRGSSIAARCGFVGIDMFAAVPDDRAIYLLKDHSTMLAKGYWTLQNDNPSFPNVPPGSGHRQDITTFDYYTTAFSSDPNFFIDSNYAVPAERRFVARVVYEAVQWRENQATGASLYELP